MPTIQVQTIEHIVSKMINKFKEGGISEIVISEDSYWEISPESLSDFSKQPELFVGSIRDDIDFLNSLVIEDYETNYLELERLASVFKFMSLKLTANG